MAKSILNILVVIALMCSCTAPKSTSDNNAEPEKVPCVETSVDDCVCLTVYKPVCGCNNKTYSNSCHAECSGVTYTEGACKE